MTFQKTVRIHKIFYPRIISALLVFSSGIALAADSQGGASTMGTMPPGAGTVGTGDIVWQESSGSSQKLSASAVTIPKVNFCVRISVKNTNESGFATMNPIDVKLWRSTYKSAVVNAQIGNQLGIKTSQKVSQQWCEFGVAKNQLPTFTVELSGQDVKGFPAKHRTQLQFPCPVSPTADISMLAQTLTSSPLMPGKFGCNGVVPQQPTYKG